MTRDIKFRAWDKNHKFMFSGTTIKEMIEGQANIHENIELMQYTGLKDNNGKEIYEGDIVKWSDKDCVDGDLLIEFSEVVYKDGAFMARNIEGSYPEVQTLSDYMGSDTEKVEVIGNIYDNPELI